MPLSVLQSSVKDPEEGECGRYHQLLYTRAFNQKLWDACEGMVLMARAADWYIAFIRARSFSPGSIVRVRNFQSRVWMFTSFPTAIDGVQLEKGKRFIRRRSSLPHEASRIVRCPSSRSHASSSERIHVQVFATRRNTSTLRSPIHVDGV